MAQQFEQIAARIDSTELAKIKNQFALREIVNADRYELIQEERKNPPLSDIFTSSSPASQITQTTMQGLKYPLELDGRGGLKLSANYDRIGEQIRELLDTRIGERVYRPFFGISELLFETIDESALAQSIRAKLLGFLPVLTELDVNVSLSESGDAQLLIFYSVKDSKPAMVRYSFSL